MAIREVSKNGRNWFEVDVRIRSQKDPSLRVQKIVRAKTRNDAVKLERELKQAVQRELVQKESVGSSWQNLVAGWADFLNESDYDDRGMLPTTAADNVRALETFTAGWMKTPVEELNRADVLDVLTRMKRDGYSPSRRRAVKGAINSVFKWGMDRRKIRRDVENPTHGVEIGRSEEKKPEILSVSEICKLLEVARQYAHPWYPIWVMAVHTGMRSGELHALLWTDVDFESRRIRVEKTYNSRLNGTKETKGGYWREVPINPELEGFLKSLRAESETQRRKHVLPRMTDWDRGEQARILRQFCHGIGITSVKFHALRACFATQLLRQSIAPVVVMKMAGWKDLKTMQRYVRLAGIEIEGATQNLQFLSPEETMGRVVELFKGTKTGGATTE